jgi:hypothetical protein
VRFFIIKRVRSRRAPIAFAFATFHRVRRARAHDASASAGAASSVAASPPKLGRLGRLGSDTLGNEKLGNANPPPEDSFFALGAASSRTGRSNFFVAFGAFFAYFSRTLYDPRLELS